MEGSGWRVDIRAGRRLPHPSPTFRPSLCLLPWVPSLAEKLPHENFQAPPRSRLQRPAAVCRGGAGCVAAVKRLEHYANAAGFVLFLVALVSLLAYAEGRLAVAGMLSLLVILVSMLFLVKR